MNTDTSMKTHLMAYLDEAVIRCPDKMAYSDGSLSVSFREAYNQSRAIGSYLARMGTAREPAVVFMNRGPNMILAFFGVLYAGKYYVPLDMEMPRFRIELILKEIKPKYLICDQETLAVASELVDPEALLLFDEIVRTKICENELRQIREKMIDTDPAYVVFTSGSTGIPKGVVACHRSVIRYVETLSGLLRINSDTIFGNQTPLYLDACLKEIFPTLKFGASAYIIPKQLFMFPLKLVDFMNEHKINTVCWVVSALTMISGLNVLDKQTPQALKTIAFASEVFPIKQFNRWRNALPDATFINLYGPTEATGVCCYYEVNRSFELDEAIPVGKPFPNTDILLLDSQNEKPRQGDSGEICIRGTALTMGYYRDSQRTSQVFVQNPLHNDYPDLIYRTGDLGVYNERGELVFISRKDNQIKHMGHRIELGEIETATMMIDKLEHAGCVYDKEKQKIWLFYVGRLEAPDVVRRLKEKLPRYMMPHQVVLLASMPLTANQKLDRQALKTMVEERKNRQKKGKMKVKE